MAACEGGGRPVVECQFLISDCHGCPIRCVTSIDTTASFMKRESRTADQLSLMRPCFLLIETGLR